MIHHSTGFLPKAQLSANEPDQDKWFHGFLVILVIIGVTALCSKKEVLIDLVIPKLGGS